MILRRRIEFLFKFSHFFFQVFKILHFLQRLLLLMFNLLLELFVFNLELLIVILNLLHLFFNILNDPVIISVFNRWCHFIWLIFISSYQILHFLFLISQMHVQLDDFCIFFRAIHLHIHDLFPHFFHFLPKVVCSCFDGVDILLGRDWWYRLCLLVLGKRLRLLLK
jgi:hypothetical protein